MKTIDKDEIVDLYNADDMSLRRIPFLDNGYIINIDNSPLETHPVLGERRHWHIYTISNNEIVALTSLDDNMLNSLIKSIEALKDD